MFLLVKRTNYVEFEMAPSSQEKSEDMLPSILSENLLFNSASTIPRKVKMVNEKNLNDVRIRPLDNVRVN